MSPDLYPVAVTGASGFIGSALTRHVLSNGRGPVCAVDDIGTDGRFQDLSGLALADFFDSSDFLRRIELDRGLPPLRAILHLGACSDTTETNGDFLMRNNFAYTRALAEWCLGHGVRFIYASSAATYGDGELGYDDDLALLPRLRPRNKYAFSKHAFDLWAREHGAFTGPGAITGLKYFNVFGPNEYHKGEMRSMVLKAYEQIQATGKVRLFKSHRPQFADGEQERDFIYVECAVAITAWFLDHPEAAGIYNIGAGVARTWNDLATAVFAALGREPQIEYVAMPEAIRNAYQYSTRADLTRLRAAGCGLPIRSLEEGVLDYVQNYLTTADPYLRASSI
ncbi:MAG TPA: ADP-glyceromanno-heptose 6-epimerase [Terriglobales bacterium]|nr:ADP-glyceromanno-heptose 6-epimerase [Terriglobales bacterium]